MVTERPERIVVVGADAAGMSAAHQAVRTAAARGRDVEVIALESTGDTSYSACGIPYWIAGDVPAADDLVARTADEHRAMGVELRLGTTVTGLDVSAGRVTHRSGDDESALGFDQLVIATGAQAIVPHWARRTDGTLLTGVAPVKTLDDGRAWLSRLDRDGGRIVIAGGGYIGVEMAEAARRRGFDTTLVTRSTVMSSLDPELGDRVAGVLRAAGVRVVEGTEVRGLDADPNGRVVRAVTADGRGIACDLVVLAVGVQPATGFAVAAGLPVGESGGLLADPCGEVAPGIWAAGDCCESLHRITGRLAFLPLGTHANKQGRVVGTNVAGGGPLTFDGVLGTAITRFAHEDHYLEIARTGLSATEASAAGIDAADLLTEGTTSSGYMPEAAPIAVKVVAEKRTRRLLGAQILGGVGAGKRIDTFATALWAGLTVDDVAWMDLSYAPPFATAWEIGQVAARRLAERMDTA